MRTMTRLAGLTFAVLAVAAAAPAEVTNCTAITSLPYGVVTPGIYCLGASLQTAEPYIHAIVIGADDVVLDLNGHTLDGSGAGAGTHAFGIRALNRKNITIRNGTIRGFSIGAFVGNYGATSQGHVVEDLRFDRNTYVALFVTGKGSIVRNNLVIGTGGSTNDPDATGIYTWGAGAHVVDNEVVETVEGVGGMALAIRIEYSPGAVIERNVVTNAAFGPSSSYGIVTAPGSPRAMAVGNRIVNMRHGIALGGGIYMDNTVGGATTPFAGGIAAGATNFVF